MCRRPYLHKLPILAVTDQDSVNRHVVHVKDLVRHEPRRTMVINTGKMNELSCKLPPILNSGAPSMYTHAENPATTVTRICPNLSIISPRNVTVPTCAKLCEIAYTNESKNSFIVQSTTNAASCTTAQECNSQLLLDSSQKWSINSIQNHLQNSSSIVSRTHSQSGTSNLQTRLNKPKPKLVSPKQPIKAINH